MVKKKFWIIITSLFIASFLTINSHAQTNIDFPGPAPGSPQTFVLNDKLILQNKLISCAWSISNGHLKPLYFRNKLTKNSIRVRDTECFLFVLEGGQTVKASDLKILGEPEIINLQPNKDSCRLAQQSSGKQISLKLTYPPKKLEVHWKVILRNDSNYVRRQFTLFAKQKSINFEEIVLLQLNEPQAKVIGIVDGSPVTVGNMFFAYEHPLSKSQKSQDNKNILQLTLPYDIQLDWDKPITHTSVIGVVPDNQLRRGFLYYIERERAHPYRPFLHYNSWYDIGYGPEKIPEQDFMAVIKLIGDKLIKQRKVKFDSFVLDDGWDDPTSLWQFNNEYPNGFLNLREVAEEYDSKIGAWLSPFGGYGKAKEQRLEYGKQQGFEINKSGFSLAGQTYYTRFRDVCTNMLEKYGLNYFKFDGIGIGGRPAGTNSEFAPDMIALLNLISDLRRTRPDVFINITTGTWASPFWLWYGDSIWRSGNDWSTYGLGSKRQQQITYRDKETYHNVVLRGPLHPLNSLMTQGFMFANHGLPEENKNLSDDIHDFFASGTNCQELYITPSLLQEHDWDTLAEAAKWSRDNADVLIDTHWIGGDPGNNEIYGWAAWSKRKAILSLRNPHDKPQKIILDIGEAFELPKGAAKRYSLKSPWKKDAGKSPIKLTAGKKHTFELSTFQVLVFDAAPQ